MTVGLAGLLVTVNAVPGAATPPSHFNSEILSRGTLSHGDLRVHPGLQIVVVKATVEAGGSSGWHSHPGGAIVIVQQGEITTYRSLEKGDEQEGSRSGDGVSAPFPQCIITRYTQGQSFIERPGEPLDAVNTGSTQTIVYATFPGVPVGGSPRTDELNPGTCPV
jgi:quercetin dioxygenase-like cupin family protein